jgi:hypothetical protein
LLSIGLDLGHANLFGNCLTMPSDSASAVENVLIHLVER